MAAHFSTLAWRIPGMGEPGWLPSLASHRVRHDCSDLPAAAAYCTEKRAWSTETQAWSTETEDLVHRDVRMVHRDAGLVH